LFTQVLQVVAAAGLAKYLRHWQAEQDDTAHEDADLASLELLSVIPQPGKILCIGLNFEATDSRPAVSAPPHSG
jgi:hypothetical protein